MTRIIHIVRAVTWGGGERYALDLCSRLVENGDKVTVVTRGLPVVDRHFSRIPVRLEKMPLGGVFDFVSPWKLARLIESYPEDRVVVHVHNFKDAEIVAKAKKLVKNKRIWHVCTRHLVKRGKDSLRWRWIYNSIDRLIFVSQLAKKEFLLGRPGIEEGKISVIPNSIIVPKGYENPVKRNKTDDFTILYTGRLSPEKGIDTLLHAFHHISDKSIKLRIVGTGDRKYEEELRELADSLGERDRIEWKGFVPDIFHELSEADLCVFPSTWREPFGLTIIEAMSQGKAVISTDNGAQPEIITDGKDGLLVEAGNEKALADAISRLAENHEVRAEFGENAYGTFNTRFSYDVFFRKIRAEYEGT
ncbi:MAG: glycosyltransferase family 4 protein [Muribaculaceae bacterium]|nr:glycosyltransferase family 4 protein [Muribaculaceae bacterium]